jgi:hypothetical protein
MALDVYVGPLVRYYRGDWETVGQRWSRESGVPLTVIRASGDSGPPAPVAEVLEAIKMWQEYLNQGLGQHLGSPIAWVEDPSAPYDTDRPGHHAYEALILWAAYAEQSTLSRPDRVPHDYGNDPAYVASTAVGFRSRYGQIVHDVEMWLPAEFSFTFRGAHLGEGDIRMGSSHELLTQLRDLNDKTWRLSESDLTRVLAEGSEKDAALHVAARFGYAVMEKLAARAVAMSVPMRLDY